MINVISNIVYFSPKVLDLKGRVPFISLVLVVLVFAVMLVDPPRVLLLMAITYALSGPVQMLWRKVAEKHRAARADSDR